MVKKFLVDVKSEMVKVSWPTRSELINSTTVVLVSAVLLSIFIYIVDVVCTFVLGAMIK